jgi:hypothetical protein
MPKYYVDHRKQGAWKEDGWMDSSIEGTQGIENKEDWYEMKH